MKKEKKITMSEADLLKVLCEHFNFNESDSHLTIYKHTSDFRNYSYNTITLTGNLNDEQC